MILRKVSLLTILLLIAVLGCEYTKPVLQPEDTIVPLSPEMSQTLMQDWWSVTTIDGAAFSESLSQLQTLVAEHVSDQMNISFLRPVINPNFRFNADGTWRLEVYYDLACERIPVLDVVDPIANSSLVLIRFILGGTFTAGYDTKKQSNVLIFETDKHTEVVIHHVNPYNEPLHHEPVPVCLDADSCPRSIFYSAFTSDLDWRIFEDKPLSKLFSSPLFDTQTDSPVVYTWDLVTTGDAGVHYTIRLYSQGQEDIILGRTDEVLD